MFYYCVTYFLFSSLFYFQDKHRQQALVHTPQQDATLEVGTVGADRPADNSPEPDSECTGMSSLLLLCQGHQWSIRQLQLPKTISYE